MLGSSVAAVFHFLCSFFGSTTCWLSIFLSVTSIGLRHRCLVSSFVILVCPRDLETAQGSCVKVVLVDLREVVCIWVLGVHGVCCNMEVEGMNTFLFRSWLHPPFSRRFVWGNFHVVPQKLACWYGVLGVMGTGPYICNYSPVAIWSRYGSPCVWRGIRFRYDVSCVCRDSDFGWSIAICLVRLFAWYVFARFVRRGFGLIPHAVSSLWDASVTSVPRRSGMACPVDLPVVPAIDASYVMISWVVGVCNRVAGLGVGLLQYVGSLALPLLEFDE